MNEITLVILIGVVDLLLVAGVVGSAWLGPQGRQSTRMAIATLAGMILSGPGFVLLLFVGSHASVAIPPRYGLSLVPAGIAVLAVAASRRRAGGWGLLGLGGVTLAALLVQTL